MRFWPARRLALRLSAKLRCKNANAGTNRLVALQKCRRRSRRSGVEQEIAEQQARWQTGRANRFTAYKCRTFTRHYSETSVIFYINAITVDGDSSKWIKSAERSALSHWRLALRLTDCCSWINVIPGSLYGLPGVTAKIGNHRSSGLILQPLIYCRTIKDEYEGYQVLPGSPVVWKRSS